MNWNGRPLALVVVGCLYIAVGTIGFAAHFDELVEVAAIICGVFLVQGRNWALWGAVAWIGLHVVLSAFDASRGLAVHSLLFLFTWLLFRPEAAQYFHPDRKRMF